MTSDPRSGSLRTHPVWHRLFAQVIRYVVAPAIFLWSGFFTSNFFISGHFSWPRTSRVLALTLTLLVLSYEFVYKEQKTNASEDQARLALVYSCMIPYVIGVFLMLAFWKL